MVVNFFAQASIQCKLIHSTSNDENHIIHTAQENNIGLKRIEWEKWKKEKMKTNRIEMNFVGYSIEQLFI